MLRIHGSTDKGRVRPTNEDHFAIDENLQLCVVADGMGGHNAGEIASRVAVDAVVEFLHGPSSIGWPFGFLPSLSREANLLRTAIQLANMRVLEVAATSSEYFGMGTTLVAGLVAGGRLVVGHVGDSRLYRLSSSGLRQLTADDSWAAGVLAHDPNASSLRLRHHPLGNALTSAVGTRAQTEVHVCEEVIDDGDVLLLTTDGVHEVLDLSRLERLLLDTDGARGARGARAVVEAAMVCGARDNCTAIVARYTSE